jgi:phosphoadenosine phosphosulfate reductase
MERAGYLAHSRSSGFRSLVARAYGLVGETLAVARRPYVSFSGGKDSLVVLHLALSVAPEIDVIWSDDEVEHPATIAYIRELASMWGLRLRIVYGPVEHRNGFRSWATDPPFRPPEPDAIRIPGRCDVWSVREGYDAVLLGTRRDESGLRETVGRIHGPLHRLATGQWRCTPLDRWRTADVWAFIVSGGLPYNPVYDDLAAVGIPRDSHDSRVGMLLLGTREVQRRAWPELARELDAYDRRRRPDRGA